MAIITISRGAYSQGKSVAEKVADALGYEIISRDILIEASELFNIPEIKLSRAIHDAPSIFERFTYGKEKYVAYIRAALLRRVRSDNVVYHGLAGHYFLQGIPHVLKVRIIAELQSRVKEEMKRENISADEARFILKKDDDERRRWSLYLYGQDTSDPTLYDLVLQLKTMTVEEAASLIVQAAQMPSFRKTPQSQAILDDLCLAAQVEAALVKDFPAVQATAKDGVVSVSIKAPMTQEAQVSSVVKAEASKVEGVKDLKVYVSPSVGTN